MECELHGDFLAECKRLPGGLVLIDSKTVQLSRVEVHLGMMEEVITDLTEVGFSKNRGKVEVSGDTRDDRLLHRFRLKPIGESLVQHLIPPALVMTKYPKSALVSFDTNLKLFWLLEGRMAAEYVL